MSATRGLCPECRQAPAGPCGYCAFCLCRGCGRAPGGVSGYCFACLPAAIFQIEREIGELLARRIADGHR